MLKINSHGASSLSSLFAVLVSAFVAAVILFVFILPAEFGKDPTGLGEKLGVIDMSTDIAEDQLESSIGAGLNPALIIDNTDNVDRIESNNHIMFAKPLQFMEVDIELGEFDEVEYKFQMEQGSQINYTWSVSGGDLAYSDLHGHNAGEDKETATDDDIDTKYLDSQEDQSISGQFIAPFDGDHGWFFLNIDQKDITITLTASGHWNSHELLPIDSYY